MSAFDIEAIKRFCDGVRKNQDIDHKKFIQHKLSGSTDKLSHQDFCKNIEQSDIAQAAFALSCLVYGGTDLKKEFGIRKKRGPKKAKLSKTIHEHEFGLVTSFVGGEITHTELSKLLMEDCEVDRTTALEYIEDKRSAAQGLIDSFYMGGAPKNHKPYQSRDEILAGGGMARSLIKK